MNNYKTIILGIIVFIVILSIFVMVDFKLRNKNKEEDKVNSNESVTTNNSPSENTILKNETIKKDNQNNKLISTTDSYDYFLLKNCMNKFYNYISYEGDIVNLIDTEVVEKLDLKENNFINNRGNGYRIDKIYKQDLNNNEKIYVVYYRLGVETLKSKDFEMWVRINSDKKAFSIYPYEYLKQNNLLNLKENDNIEIGFIDEITINTENTYKDEEIITNDKAYMYELFARYKFDLLMDREHLYDSIDKEYRDEKIISINNMEKYIQENRTKLYIESIDRYIVKKNETKKEFVEIGSSGRYYIFYMKNIMDYSLIFDDYTIVTGNQLELYNNSLPNIQAEYCINRIIRAINSKDYDFIYEKLDPVQKSNYYSNKEDFIDFIKTSFWEKNIYQVVDTYMLSNNVFQYNIRLTDKGGLPGYKSYRVAITLREGEDFYIAIKKN